MRKFNVSLRISSGFGKYIFYIILWYRASVGQVPTLFATSVMVHLMKEKYIYCVHAT